MNSICRVGCQLSNTTYDYFERKQTIIQIITQQSLLQGSYFLTSYLQLVEPFLLKNMKQLAQKINYSTEEFDEEITKIKKNLFGEENYNNFFGEDKSVFEI